MRSIRFGVIAALGLFAALVMAPWFGWQAWKESEWSSVTGQIRAVSVVKQPSRRSRQRFELPLRYEYEVGGKRFSSERWSFSEELTLRSRADADARAAELAPGTEVTVYFDPDHPGDAVLARESGLDAWCALGGGLLFFVIGLVGYRRSAAR